MNLQTLISEIPLLQQIGSTQLNVTALEVDSRRCRAGAVFVAVPTTHNDGHTFIAAAIDAGAVAIVCQTLPEVLRPGITYLRVANSRQALAVLALRFHGSPQTKLRFIGVTGTNGKTTCTYLLRSILQAAGAKVAIIGTTGNIILQTFEKSKFTTPEQPALAELLARMLAAGVEWVIMEVSSHALAQNRVAAINFDGALFTNITRDHLDFHASMRDYIAAKCLLFSSLDSRAVASINADDSHAGIVMSAAAKSQGLSYGRLPESDVRILDEHGRPDGTKFSLSFGLADEPKQTVEIDLQVPGGFNVMNAAGAAALCLGLGFNVGAVREGLSHAKAAPGRMQTFVLPNGARAIVDYAHTPDALTNALAACRANQPAAGALICVFGCGGDRDAGKRPLMGRAAAEFADVLIITNDNPRNEDPQKIADDIIAGISGYPGRILKICLDRGAAIEMALSTAKPHDTVLIAGKGHETYQIIGAERLDFSDAKAVAGFIRKQSANQG